MITLLRHFNHATTVIKLGNKLYKSDLQRDCTKITDSYQLYRGRSPLAKSRTISKSDIVGKVKLNNCHRQLLMYLLLQGSGIGYP